MSNEHVIEHIHDLRGSVEALRTMFMAIASTFPPETQAITLEQLKYLKPVVIDHRAQHGAPAIMLAAMQRELETVEQLLQANVDRGTR
ncbi:hypothetical protein EZI45_19015 [Delftia tsuruhatensis]|uniref:hypothetical protein n=1 Tax=Delftia tsuruhatensis TaxID=180282 RepID=UPI00105679AF|nr:MULTISPECIES: hypothetical protein [Delftia]MCX7504536.1 hypothetical protein [Delftia tsuruhatensis]TDF26212.1 hypothetical protein EZI45_19015 [Delftia tsuruhatensis]